MGILWYLNNCGLLPFIFAWHLLEEECFRAYGQQKIRQTSKSKLTSIIFVLRHGRLAVCGRTAS